MSRKEAIYKVRQNLWRRDFRVQDMSGTELGFDLLVEGKYRVIVNHDGMGRSYDVIAQVSEGTGAFKGKFAIAYSTKDVHTTTLPSRVFGLPKSKGKYGKKIEGKKEGKENKEAKEK